MKSVVLAATLLASVAHAQPKLESVGVCGFDQLPGRVAEIVGAPRAGAPRTIRITTREAGGILRAEVEVVDAAARRVIEGASCDDLSDSLAVVVALLLREAPPARPKLPVDIERRDVVAADEPIRHRAVEVSGAASTRGHLELLVGGRVRRGRLGWNLELRLEQPDQIPAGLGMASVAGTRLAFGPCVGSGRLAGCALGAIGVIRGSTEDLMQGRSAILPSATVGARLEWRERLNARLGLRVFAEVHVALARAEFLLDDVAIWTEPRAQVHVGAGGFLNFP